MKLILFFGILFLISVNAFDFSKLSNNIANQLEAHKATIEARHVGRYGEPNCPQESVATCPVINCTNQIDDNCDVTRVTAIPQLCANCSSLLEEAFNATDGETACQAFSQTIACFEEANNPACSFFSKARLPALCVDIVINGLGYDQCNCNPSNETLDTCQFQLFCDNGTCTEKKGLGEECETDAECGDSFSLFDDIWICAEQQQNETQNVTKVCQRPESAYIGDPCESDDQCFFGRNGSVTCTDGVCQGVGDGEQCTSFLECNAGFFCDNGVCCPQITEKDEECNANATAACQLPLVCYPDTNQCGDPFRGAVGDQCLDSYHCEVGLWCNLQLQNETSTTMIGTCAEVPELGMTCTNDSDCPEIQFCECSILTGESSCFLNTSALFKEENGRTNAPLNVANSSCVEQFQALAQCAFHDHDCKFITARQESCAQSECPDEFREFFSCWFPGLVELQSVILNFPELPSCLQIPPFNQTTESDCKK